MGQKDRSKANKRTLRRALLVALGMFGFGYLLVPIYNSVCEALGINGQTAQISANTVVEPDTGRTITITFDANVNSKLPWSFKPMTHRLEVHPGQFAQVSYLAHNLSGTDIIGQAAHSVTPQRAAMYFKKSECFCYSQQPLQSGQSKEMPVVFMIDPKLPEDIKEITLSYTFLRADRYASAQQVQGGAVAK